MASAHFYILIVMPLFILFKLSTAFSNDHFVAAVYEHVRQGDWSQNSSTVIKQTNLEYYKNATIVAKAYGADIILFPEYGLFPPEKRRRLKKYLEVIPNPKEHRVIPCDEPDVYSKRPILYSLSCIAKTNNIVVVANMGGIENCKENANCSEDGVLHMNANVAFDQNGTLVGRYYKEHLYFEIGMDLPREQQDPTFETNFGKFAMFICFEIIFKKMADFGRSKDIDAILFSTLWMNSSPFFISTQWWQAWAMGNNATLLAANLGMPGYLSTGIGIYAGRNGSIASTLNPDGIPKLIIANVPKRNGSKVSPKSKVLSFTKSGIKEWKNDGENVPVRCSYKHLGKSSNILTDYRCFSEDLANYTLIKLNKSEDRLKLCNNGMCCELEYVASTMMESFYFGVFNGTQVPYMRYRWAEENCMLARCNDVGGKACSEFPMISKTVFHKIALTANFTTDYIYPSLLGNQMKLVPVKDWTFETKGDTASIDFNSDSGIQLLATGFKSRVYDRDPPYVR